MQLLPSLLIAESPRRGLFQASGSRDSRALGQGLEGGDSCLAVGGQLARAHSSAAAPAQRAPTPCVRDARRRERRSLCPAHCPKPALRWCPGLGSHGEGGSWRPGSEFSRQPASPLGWLWGHVRATKGSSGRDLCSELRSAPASESLRLNGPKVSVLGDSLQHLRHLLNPLHADFVPCRYG